MLQRSFHPLPDLDGYRIIRKLGPRPNGTSIILQSDSDIAHSFAKIIPQCTNASFDMWLAKAARIDSPLCPTLIGAGTSAEQFIILRTFIEGESLETHLARGRDFLLDDCLAFMIHLGECLRLIHAVGLFHGKLKPSNVIISPSFVPCVTEIHVPYFPFRELSVTRTGFQVEHPAHLSPEHFDPDPVVDIRTDIFCLGTIAYRMLTRRLPFFGDTPAEIKLNILNLEPSPPASIPPALSSTVMKMLEKKPGRRYQSPQELLDDLEAIRRGQVIVQEPPPQPEPKRRRRFPAIQPLYWMAGLFVCALTIIIAIITVSQQDKQPAITPLAARRRASFRLPPSNTQAEERQQPADAAKLMLGNAEEPANEQPGKALALLDRIIRDYPGTPAAAQAIQAKASLAKSAASTAVTEKSKLEEMVRNLVAQNKFGEALALYTRFMEDHRQDRSAAEQAQLAIIALKGQAEKRFTALKTEAEEHATAKRYEKAAMLYALVHDSFGMEQHVTAAAQRLAILEPLVKAEREKRLAEQQSAQQRAFLQMILPAEQKARLWQFVQAAKECDALSGTTKDQHTLSQIADQKREYELLARLKDRLIETITASAPIQLSALHTNRA